MLEFRNIKKDDTQSHLCVFKGRRGEEGGRFKRSSGRAWIIALLFTHSLSFAQENFILKTKEISGKISPKSVVSDGNGNFAAQNMMYRHCITFYDEAGDLLYRMNDEVNLSEFGIEKYGSERIQGGPVEAVYSNDGEYIYVSNYAMEGESFSNPGCDGCIGSEYDNSFIYKIRVADYVIENVIEVGAVPKYLALSPDNSLLIASNWTSSDISIISLAQEKEIKRVKVGAHPRGVVIDSKSENAYVTIMGSSKIAIVNLNDYSVNYINSIGRSPRHLCLTSNDSLLYVSVNSSNTIVKYNLHSDEKEICRTNAGPRSMILSPNEDFLYVVNYFANTFSKIQTDSMMVAEVQETNEHPIGISANWSTGEIWVACYVGLIEIHKDFELAAQNESFFMNLADLSSFFQEEGIEKKSSKPEPVIEDEKDDAGNLIVDDESIQNEGADSTEKVVEVVLAPRLNISQGKKLDYNSLPKKEVETAHPENCDYHVITGTFSIHENAVKRGGEISQKGYKVELIRGKSGVTYVSAKCFSSRELAHQGISEIEAVTGIKGWVLKY